MGVPPPDRDADLTRTFRRSWEQVDPGRQLVPTIRGDGRVGAADGGSIDSLLVSTRAAIAAADRLVVKVGSSSLTGPDGGLDAAALLAPGQRAGRSPPHRHVGRPRVLGGDRRGPGPARPRPPPPRPRHPAGGGQRRAGRPRRRVPARLRRPRAHRRPGPAHRGRRHPANPLRQRPPDPRTAAWRSASCPSSTRTTPSRPTRSGSATTTGWPRWWRTSSTPTRSCCCPTSTPSTTGRPTGRAAVASRRSAAPADLADVVVKGYGVERRYRRHGDQAGGGRHRDRGGVPTLLTSADRVREGLAGADVGTLFTPDRVAPGLAAAAGSPTRPSPGAACSSTPAPFAPSSTGGSRCYRPGSPLSRAGSTRATPSTSVPAGGPTGGPRAGQLLVRRASAACSGGPPTTWPAISAAVRARGHPPRRDGAAGPVTGAVVPSVVHVPMPQGTQGSTLLRVAERLSEAHTGAGGDAAVALGARTGDRSGSRPAGGRTEPCGSTTGRRPEGRRPGPARTAAAALRPRLRPRGRGRRRRAAGPRPALRGALRRGQPAPVGTVASQRLSRMPVRPQPAVPELRARRAETTVAARGPGGLRRRAPDGRRPTSGWAAVTA